MKIFRYTLTAIALSAIAFGSFAQENSSSSVVQRRSSKDRNKTESTSGVTARMQGFYDTGKSNLSEGDVQWMRVIYRHLDLNKNENAPLYFPEEPIEGQENLFRIMMRLLANNELTVYEYLDGREVFNDSYKLNVKDMLDRFYIIYEPAKGSTEKNPKFTINEADIPTNEVLSYYIIEKWVYDTRNNRLVPTVEALCPVLHRVGDFGGEAVRYPMFWVKYNDIRPHLAQQAIFVDDSNNLPTCTYDDFFNLTMYDGEIYKTRNLKNKSMAQLYPDSKDLKRAQDSIQHSLDSFEMRLWTPTREELQARAEAADSIAAAKEEAAAAVAAANDSTSVDPADNKEKKSTVKRTTKRSEKKSVRKSNRKKKENNPKKKEKKTSIKESNASKSSSATRSVRRRRS